MLQEQQFKSSQVNSEDFSQFGSLTKNIQDKAHCSINKHKLISFCDCGTGTQQEFCMHEPKFGLIPEKSILKKKFNRSSRRKLTLKDLERQGVKSNDNQGTTLDEILQKKIEKFHETKEQMKLNFDDQLRQHYGEKGCESDE